MPWDPTKPAGSDAANTIDNTTQPNFSALDTWASAITDGVSAGTAAVVKAYRAANAVIAKFRAAGGDTDDRFRYDLNGQLEWGSGSAAPDVVLSRSAANVLRLASGDAIRSQTDPANAEDLVRKSYVDATTNAITATADVSFGATETVIDTFNITLPAGVTKLMAGAIYTVEAVTSPHGTRVRLYVAGTVRAALNLNPSAAGERMAGSLSAVVTGLTAGGTITVEARGVADADTSTTRATSSDPGHLWAVSVR